MLTFPSILHTSSVFMELRLHPALCHVYLKSHFLAPLSSSSNYTLLYCCVQVYQAKPLIDPSSQARLSLPLTSALPLSITITHCPACSLPGTHLPSHLLPGPFWWSLLPLIPCSVYLTLALPWDGLFCCLELSGSSCMYACLAYHVVLSCDRLEYELCNGKSCVLYSSLSVSEMPVQ